MSLAIGMGIGIPFNYVLNAFVNSATAWYFGANGLEGTPWSALTRTGLGTRVGPTGLIESTTSPRIDYDPVTLAARGLLVEGQATQHLPKSDDLTDAVWQRSAVALPVAASTYRGRPLWTIEVTGAGNYIFAAASLAAGSYVARVHLFAGTSSSYGGGLFDATTSGFANLSVTKISGPGAVTGGGGAQLTVTGLSGSVPTIVDMRITVSVSSSVYVISYVGNSGVIGSTNKIQYDNVELGSVATSYIPNAGTGTAVRVADWTGPGVALTGAALADAFPGGLTQPFTGVFKYTKTYSAASNETLFALSAGSTAGGTNLFAARANGTQAQLVTSAGAGTLTGTLVHDGSTVNRIAYSVDPVAGKMSISVNGAATVETTGIAYTGAGVAALIPGSQTYGGTEPVTQLHISSWDNSRTAYLTGAALQALTA